jgi:urease accessory protein
MSTPNLHPLLLLSDSALPLGSFAFSSGLESFLAHNQHTTTSNNANKLAAFDSFLEQSLANIASTSLPYVLAAYRRAGDQPGLLEELDNDFDASTPCTVARRASVAQGRAILAVWERALYSSVPSGDAAAEGAGRVLTEFAASIKGSKPDRYGLQERNGHFAPLFGLVCSALGLNAEDTVYIFLLNHAKAVLSAAVRASVMGPYHSQAVLASARLRGWIGRCLARESGDSNALVEGKGVEEACVTVPEMDLWMGRHELLYSRIFNS